MTTRRMFWLPDDIVLENDINIQKATIQTPMKDGKVHLQSVPVGASVWITVTNPESPLHGRPILITKRPDGLMALTGGAGASTEARRHMVLTGTPKKTKRDKELEQQIDDIHDYNDPIITKKKELEAESRKEIKEASGKMMQALGITKPNKKDLLGKKDEVQNYIEEALGPDEKDQAKRLTDTFMRHVVATERKVGERVQRERQYVLAKVGKRLSRLAEEPDLQEIQQQLPSYDSFTVNVPDIAAIKDLPPAQQEHVLSDYLEKQADLFFEPDRNDHHLDDAEENPQIEIGTNVKPLELKSEVDLGKAIDSIQDYWAKRKEAEYQGSLMKKVRGISPAAPSTLNTLKAEVAAANINVTPEEVEQRAEDNYNKWMSDTSAMAFYDAVSSHWSEDTALTDTLDDKNRYDSTMKFHIDSGAATAIAALAKEHLGVRMDTKRLIENGNVELAAATLAYALRTKDGQTTQEYDSMVDSVRDFNAQNQKATEAKALERHSDLDRQYQEIQRQKGSGELLDQVRTSSLELNNLLEQRRNLGNALGSLQVSASFFDSLEKFKTARNDVVPINVGKNIDDAHNLRAKLRMSEKNSDIDTSDPDNITVRVGLSALGRHVTTEKDIQTKADQFEAIKTDMSGIVEDSRGNLVAEDYDVPFFKRTFTDEAGDEQDYQWRVEQRNDINWLLKTTEAGEDNPLGQGGGLVTRVVGAGKTNTALGFFAHKLDANPDYKAIIAVPKGRSQQWVDEARKFSDLPIVHIPDGMAKAQVDDILIDSQPGTIFVTGHREASRSHDILTALQTNPGFKGKFHGITIDEPQEMMTGQTGKVGAMGKRLMKLPFDHRIGLTATPAQAKPTEAFDLIKWTAANPKELGSKAAFDRSFSGFTGGVNTQDAAISKALFAAIQPYVSGSRIMNPTFKTEHNTIQMGRSPVQVQKQKDIESGAENFVKQHRQEIIDAVRNNPNHSWRRSANWESRLSGNATKEARKKVEEQHRENIDDGEWRNNAKLSALQSNLDPNQKHVIFIDSKVQRNSLMNMLADSGYSSARIKNIAATTTSISGREMADRVKAFKENPNINIMLIDKKSSSGYNLQQGDQMHFIGDPENAATYLQAQGRVARMPRKGDVKMNTYKYSDDVSEQAKWVELEAQLKLLKSVAPAMVSE